MAAPISPPRRERSRYSSISSPSAIVQHPVTACPYPACSGPYHHAHSWLKLTASLSDSSRTCHRVSQKPNAATVFHIVAWSRCFVPRSLGFSEPFCRLSRMSFSVMCFWSHSVRVSKCLILPTLLLAPIPLAAEASPSM